MPGAPQSGLQRRRSTVAMVRRPSFVSTPAASQAAEAKVLPSLHPNRVRTVLAYTPRSSLAAKTGDGTLSVDSSVSPAVVSCPPRKTKYEVEVVISLDDVNGESVAALHELPREAVAGRNAALIWLYSGSGRRQYDMLLERSLTECVGLLSKASLNADQASCMVYEVLVNCFSFGSDNRVVDHFSGTSTYRRPNLAAHPILGTRLLGLHHRVIHSDADVSAVVASIWAIGKSETSMVTCLVKQIIGSPPESPKTVLLSNLTFAFVREEDFSMVTKAADASISAGDASLQYHLFCGLLGGGPFRTTVATSVVEEEDGVASQTLLSTLNRCTAVVSAGVSNGNVEVVIGELQSQCRALRSRLLLGLDVALRRRVEKDLLLKESQVAELEDVGLRAGEQFLMTRQLQRATHMQHANETETKRTILQLGDEKRRRFAQAFRVAFVKSQMDQAHVRTTTSLEARLLEMERKVSAAVADSTSLRDEVSELHRVNSRLLQHVSEETAMRAHWEGEASRIQQLSDGHLVKISTLELRVCELQCQNTAKSLEVSERWNLASGDAVHAKTALAALQQTFDQLLEEHLLLQCGWTANTAAVRREEREKMCHVEMERSQLCEQLRLREKEFTDLKGKCSSCEAVLLDLRRDHLALIDENERLREETHHRLHTMKEKHRIEREGYLEFLHEGRCYLEEVQQYWRMRVPSAGETDPSKQLSLYRGGRLAVERWLSEVGHHLPSLAPVFFQQGFDTTHAMSMLTEEDLVKMNITAGNRRKLLHSAQLLAGHYQKAFDDSTALFRGPPCSNGAALSWSADDINQHWNTPESMDGLLDDLETWMGDLQIAISTEASHSGS